ncbi:MAG: Tlg2-vesicle protein [Thelocarpon impressellum]|nr:MAG: Tlg2-vesicle protein [Thelocarpon impressellum]
MSLDRDSTARVLAIGTSPPDSPKAARDAPFHPPWTRPRSSFSRRRDQAVYVGGRTFAHKLRLVVEQTWRQLYRTAERMAWWQRLAVAVAVLATGVLGLLFLIYSERVFHWLVPVAARWRDMPAGWLIVWAMTFVCAFPPVVGFSTTLTIAGFVYGIPVGWLIIATATVAGSLCSFVVSRTILSGYVQRLIANDRRFAAFALTLKHDGLKLLVMIRFCPLPYSLSNGAMSTVPTVQPLTFALATAISTPKLLTHVFIGRQLARIAESGGKMSGQARLINYTSIALGGVLGMAVGWIIYSKTVARARELEAEERAGPGGRASVDSGFADDPDADDMAAPDVFDDETDVDEGEYHDEYTDDDVLRLGDGDVEQAVGLDRLSKTGSR